MLIIAFLYGQQKDWQQEFITSKKNDDNTFLVTTFWQQLFGSKNLLRASNKTRWQQLWQQELVTKF
jgi:hypothetical protein